MSPKPKVLVVDDEEAIRSSLRIFSFVASRVALSGYSNQEKTTFSSGLASTALRKSVTFPSGTSLSQVSTVRVTPMSWNIGPCTTN